MPQKSNRWKKSIFIGNKMDKKLFEKSVKSAERAYPNYEFRVKKYKDGYSLQEKKKTSKRK